MKSDRAEGALQLGVAVLYHPGARAWAVYFQSGADSDGVPEMEPATERAFATWQSAVAYVTEFMTQLAEHARAPGVDPGIAAAFGPARDA